MGWFKKSRSSFTSDIQADISHRLYFVKIDIANCYDTLDQGLLVKILENVLDSVKFSLVYIGMHLLID